MNAKKIMGAVLVALLAAALFVGAGAAEPSQADGTTVFVYQPVLDGKGYTGTWANGVNTVTFESISDTENAIIGTDIVEGTYTKGEESIIVKYPTAVITGIAGVVGAEYSFIGGNVYESDLKEVDPTTLFTNATGTDVEAIGYIITGEDNIPVELTSETEFEEGEYKIQVIFDPADFFKGMPANYIYGAVYTFNVVDDDEATVVG